MSLVLLELENYTVTGVLIKEKKMAEISTRGLFFSYLIAVFNYFKVSSSLFAISCQTIFF